MPFIVSLLLQPFHTSDHFKLTICCWLIFIIVAVVKSFCDLKMFIAIDRDNLISSCCIRLQNITMEEKKFENFWNWDFRNAITMCMAWNAEMRRYKAKQSKAKQERRNNFFFITKANRNQGQTKDFYAIDFYILTLELVV